MVTLYEHLGDVNYFLEKRRLDNMRDVEKRTKTGGGQKSSDNAVPVLGAEEKKQLERAVQKAENVLQTWKSDVKKFEEKMADPDFYNRPDSNDQLKNTPI
jgi:ATP-binding cassette subfamily F protein 3